MLFRSGVPTKLGAGGVEGIVEWDLTEFEREQLGSAVDKLGDQYDEIG